MGWRDAPLVQQPKWKSAPLVEQDSGFGDMLRNVPESAFNVAKDAIHPILHPIQTAESLYNLGSGAVQKLIPGEQGNEVYADAVGQAIKGRYGSLDALQQTVTDDPVGVLGDASALLTGGGTALARVGPVAKMAQTAGAAIDPLNLARNAPAAAIGAITPKALPASMYESAAKWRPSLDRATRDQLTETALSEGLMPTAKGFQKLNEGVTELSSKIDAIVDKATNDGVNIPRSDIYRELKSLKEKVGGVRLDASDDLAVVDKIIDKFDSHMDALGKDTLTPRELQEFKKNAYEKINFDLEQGSASWAKNETRKSMARAARESIEQIDPNVAELNQRLGGFLELRPELARAANRIENRDVIGLSGPMKTTAGGVVGGDAGAAVGMLAGLLDFPKPKATAALLMDGWRRNGLLGNLANARVTPALTRGLLFEAGKLDQELRKN